MLHTGIWYRYKMKYVDNKSVVFKEFKDITYWNTVLNKMRYRVVTLLWY